MIFGSLFLLINILPPPAPPLPLPLPLPPLRITYLNYIYFGTSFLFLSRVGKAFLFYKGNLRICKGK